MLDNTTAMKKNRKCGTVNNRVSHYENQPQSVIAPLEAIRKFDSMVRNHDPFLMSFFFVMSSKFESVIESYADSIFSLLL